MSLRLLVVALALLLAVDSTVHVDGAPASVCPYTCQNGGVCVASRCQCKSGFVGIDCQRRGCASNCNHRGYCDLGSTPPSCLCFTGYSGLECELFVAPGSSTATPATTATANSTTGTKPLDRTICNPGCDAVNGICWQGACACADGFTGPTCTDRLCPDDCSYRGRCDKKSGECECYKPYTGVTCAGATETVVPREVDTLADVEGGTPSSGNVVNVVNKAKKGLSDSFHLIEENSQMQTVTEYN